jgi:2-(1,2-epoxy-1,2-dihydrophenyl)acetyl-CoA isomerase
VGTAQTVVEAGPERPGPRRYTERMIRYSVGDDHVARLVLDRPDAKNALSVEMRDDIIGCVRQARGDREVRALLVTGTGDSFCSGMDLRQSTVGAAGSAGFDPRNTSEALRVGVQTFIRELWELDKPTVAAVNGTAVGPGAHLALACDVVLTCDQTRFIWSFAKWGLVVDAGGAYLLPRLVGLPRAKAMVMLGDGATGAEAVELGLAYRCVPSPDELAALATELATRLAAGPTRSLGLSKMLLNSSFETTLSESLEREGLAQAMAATSPEMAEGMAAFKERRPPDFPGLS